MVSLQDFYDTLETHIPGLEALGKSQESYGDTLVPIIHKKLPVELKTSLARDHSNKEWALYELKEVEEEEEEEEPLLIYTAQGSPFRRKKLSVINGSPEQKVEILKAGRSNSDLPELPNNHS